MPQTSGGKAKASLGAFYNAVFKDAGLRLPPHLAPVCRALEDNRITQLMVLLGPGLGKSNLCSIIYPAWAIGTNPTLTVLGVSAGEALIQGFMSAVMSIIENSPHFQHLFPDVKPDKSSSGGWSTEKGLFVTGRRIGDADASYFGAGLMSTRLTGVHGRIVIMDDLLTHDNAQTVEQRRAVKDRYFSTLAGRGDPQGARYIVVGRRWAQDDFYQMLIDSGQYVVMSLPVERKGADFLPDYGSRLFWDVKVPDGLECCFTEQPVANA